MHLLKAIAIPSPSELTFSETGMVLTKLLLVEVHDILRRNMSKKLVDEVLAQRYEYVTSKREDAFPCHPIASTFHILCFIFFWATRNPSCRC